jgi:hypothetical protein
MNNIYYIGPKECNSLSLSLYIYIYRVHLVVKPVHGSVILTNSLVVIYCNTIPPIVRLGAPQTVRLEKNLKVEADDPTTPLP